MQETDTALYTDEDLVGRLTDAVSAAASEERPYAIVALVPQRLPGEEPPDVSRVVSDCLRELVRDDDTAGLIGGNIVAVGLPDNSQNGARVFAYRLQGDLGLRSAQTRVTVWDAGIAAMPEDGMTAEDVLGTAIDSARTKRRRLGL